MLAEKCWIAGRRKGHVSTPRKNGKRLPQLPRVLQLWAQIMAALVRFLLYFMLGLSRFDSVCPELRVMLEL